MINETNNMGGTAIIDCRGPDPGLAHDAYRAFAVRARLDRANGTHANQLIWEGPAPIVGDADCDADEPDRDGPLAGGDRARHQLAAARPEGDQPTSRPP